MRIRLQPIDFLFRDSKTWTAKEQRAYKRYVKWHGTDMKLYFSLSGDPDYRGKMVAIFHGRILAADADIDKVISEVERLGGTKLREQTHFHYIYPKNTILVMPSTA